MRHINLILAGFWAIVGLVLFWPGWMIPGQDVVYLPGTKLPLGWIALVLAAYNVVRWRLQSGESRRQRAWQEAMTELHRRRRRQDVTTEPDPNFMFTDEPPKAQ